MKFVNNPNLPENAASVIVSGEISERSIDTLLSAGVKCIKTHAEPILYDAVKFHPDMQLHHIGGKHFLCSSIAKNILPQEAEAAVQDIPSGEYPGDVIFNAARVGKFMICNPKHTSLLILNYCRKNMITIIPVSQGYAKCNVCVIDKKSIITSDMGIAKACKKFPIDVLHVDDSNVKLCGFSHGFFGGAAGKIRKDLLAVNGNINSHKNASEIKAFAYERGVDILSLNNEIITDIGSVIPICEK